MVAAGFASKTNIKSPEISLGVFFYEEKMPEKEVINELQAVSASGAFAAICGLLNYLLTVQEGRPFSFKELLLHGLISAICGLICYEVMSYEGFPPNLCGALSGMAGWGGTRLIRLIELIIIKRSGVSKEELEE